MMRPTGIAVVLLLLAGHAAAQDPVLLTGPVEWTPRLDLRDFGYDNNVFLEPGGRALEDITGTLIPSLLVRLSSTRLDLQSTLSTDLVYFERYVEQRAFNQRYDGRAAFTVSLFQPFVAAEWQSQRDRQSPEVDIRARRGTRTKQVGVGLFSLDRASFTMSMGRTRTEYTSGQVFDGVDLAEQLNRESDTLALSFNFTATPLIAVTATASVLREHYLLVDEKDQENQQVTVGLTFAPDAMLTGRASFGYSRQTVEDPGAIPFQGYTTDVNVSYAMFDATRMTVRYSRATAASIREPYYLQTLYGGELRQAFLGPVDLVARGSRQALDYPGLPSRNVAGHVEFINSYAGGVVVRLSGNSSIDITYEVARRDADDPAQRFDRRRIVTAVALGF